MERKNVNEETLFNQDELKNSQSKKNAWKQENPTFNWFEAWFQKVNNWIVANKTLIFNIEVMCLIVAIMLGSIKFGLPLAIGISASALLVVLCNLAPKSMVVFNYFLLIVAMTILFVGIIVILYVLFAIIIMFVLTIALSIMINKGIRRCKVFFAKRKRKLNSN